LRTERGSILVHVLMTGIVVALIAATLLRMSMLRYQMAGRAEKVLKEKRDDQAALASIMTAWNANGTSQAQCSAPVPPGFSGCLNAAAPPANCNCTCTRFDGLTVQASLVGGVCQLNIISKDLQ
jgi:hypothetical protein